MTLAKIQKTIFKVDSNTLPAAGHTYSIQNSGGGSAIPIYANSSGTIPLDNPGTLPPNGLLSFFIRPGTCRIKINGPEPTDEQIWDNEPCISPDVLSSASATLQFATIADLINCNPINKGETIDPADYVGQKVSTVVNNTTSKKGGAEYIIKTADQATADGDVIDGNINCWLLGGMDYAAIHVVKNGELPLVAAGWLPETDNSSKIDSLLDYCAASEGITVLLGQDEFEINSPIDISRDRSPSAYDKVKFRGESKTNSGFYTNTNIPLFIIDNRADFRQLFIEQRNGLSEGFGIRSRYDGQVSKAVFEDLEITGFKFGMWIRYSIWCTWKNVFFNHNLCGLKLSRNGLPHDNSDPEPPAGWNNGSNGWFHNQGVLDNVVFNGGEVGFFGCCMGFTFNSCTAQDQRENVSGSIIPLTQEATGFIINAGEDSTFSGWGNIFNSPYFEYTRRPFAIYSQRYIVIDSAFVQGGSSGDRYETPVYANYSNVYVTGMTGQDYFSYKCVLENNTSLYGDTAGAYSGVPSQVDSTSHWCRYTEYCNFVKSYQFSKSSGSVATVTVPIVLLDNCIYKVSFLSLRDGSSVRSASYTVSRWNNNINTNIDIESGSESGFSLAISSGKLAFSIGDTLSWSGRICVEKLTEFSFYDQAVITPT